MPTSKGLSYSMNSLPRSGCTIGAFSRCASATTSACAPAQPAPHSSVTFVPAFSSAASRSSSASVGRTIGCAGTSQAGGFASVGRSATSPGITTTDTPRRATAVRIARSRICGSWPGLETSST